MFPEIKSKKYLSQAFCISDKTECVFFGKYTTISGTKVDNLTKSWYNYTNFQNGIKKGHSNEHSVFDIHCHIHGSGYCDRSMVLKKSK